VKYAVIPQAYTIIALGISLFLMPFMTGGMIEPWMDGMPQYLIHPIYTVEFCLWLSTAIVWFIAFALSLRNIRKKALRLTEAVEQNFLVVSLATITVVVALSGCVSLSRPMYYTAHLPPQLSYAFMYATLIGFYGILICEPAWIIAVLWRYRKHKREPINLVNRYAVISQIYTIIAFGASIVLMPLLTLPAFGPSVEGMPRYLIHPFFTLDFSLWLTTAIVWFIAFALSLRYIHKKALKLTEIVGQNLHVISLATITVIVALSGCVGFSDTIHFTPGIMSPPSPLLFSTRMINFFGVLICEPVWIVAVLWGYLSARRARP